MKYSLNLLSKYKYIKHQIHRGNLNDIVKNIANKNASNKSQTIKSPIQENVKPTFVPIKDKIKQMEQNNKITYESENSKFEQKFMEIVDHSIENNKENINEEELEPRSSSLEKSDSVETPEINSEGNEINGKYQNGSIPPKPLPRTSRTNSVSDQGNDEISNGSNGGSRPVAKPRTTASSYKVLKCCVHF